MYVASQPAASWMTLVPEEETRTKGRCVSLRAAIAAGLLSISKPGGIFPPDSPARRGLSNCSASSRAAVIVGTGKHRHPAAAAVIAVVVARITSTATIAQPSLYLLTLSGE